MPEEVQYMKESTKALINKLGVVAAFANLAVVTIKLVRKVTEK